jgi:hypothetical protein
MRLGQFEGAIQKQFYELPPRDKAAADAGIFKKDYSDRAHYSYLGPLTLGFQRSYYSQIIVAGSLKVKLIALDTNHLDSIEQQSFFQKELQGFDGKILIFGHHPPVTDDAKQQGADSWDAPDGWDKFRPYVTNEQGKNIALWLFGHVHDYQRRGASNGGVVPAPAFVVAGGGGASLDAHAPVYQWHAEA